MSEEILSNERLEEIGRIYKKMQLIQKFLDLNDNNLIVGIVFAKKNGNNEVKTFDTIDIISPLTFSNALKPTIEKLKQELKELDKKFVEVNSTNSELN